jgi:cholesterol transport system auxiliary component
LDTDRILTLSDDAELNQFAAARWADNLPELVTSLVSRTLEASGRFEIVSGRAGGGSESCELRLELEEFFARLSPSGQTTGVQVAIEGRFQCESAEPALLKLNTSIPVHDDRMSVIVAAFQQAMNSVMKDLLEQL